MPKKRILIKGIREKLSSGEFPLSEVEIDSTLKSSQKGDLRREYAQGGYTAEKVLEEREYQFLTDGFLHNLKRLQLIRLDNFKKRYISEVSRILPSRIVAQFPKTEVVDWQMCFEQMVSNVRSQLKRVYASDVPNQEKLQAVMNITRGVRDKNSACASVMKALVKNLDHFLRFGSVKIPVVLEDPSYNEEQSIEVRKKAIEV